MKKLVAATCLSLATLAAAQPAPPPPPAVPLPPEHVVRTTRIRHGGPGPMALLESPTGIPPQVATRLGISVENQKKVRDLAYEANSQLIGLEADLKRAQLELDRVLGADTVDEGATMSRLDAVGKTELAVRKNRVGLMLKVKKLVGNETWSRLLAEADDEDDAFRITTRGDRRMRKVEIVREETKP